MTDSTNPYESPQSETKGLLAATPAESKWRCHGARLVAWVLLVLLLGAFVYGSWAAPPNAAFGRHPSVSLLLVIALFLAALCGAWFNWPWYVFGAVYGVLAAIFGAKVPGEKEDIGTFAGWIVSGAVGWVIMGAIIEAVCAWIICAAAKPLDTQPSKAENNESTD